MHVSTDPSIMALPHPVRVASAVDGIIGIYKQALGPEWAIIERYLKNPDMILPTACFAMTQDNPMPRFRSMIGMIEKDVSNTEQGGVYSMTSFMRHSVLPYPMFKFEDSLIELLEHVDFADDIPLSYINPPYPKCYIELGSKRRLDSEAFLINEQSGKHALEGAYIESGKAPEGYECLYILLTGSPLGHDNALDDGTLSLVIDVSDPNQSLTAALIQAFERQKEAVEKHHLRPTGSDTLPPTQAALRLLAKALLYLGLSGVRKEVCKDATELAKSMAAIKSSAKKAKAARKAAKVYDHILVKAPQESGLAEDRSQGDGRSVKMHWRRGHMRMQAHGPAMSLRKLIMISPTLVNALSDAEEPPATKTYTVR